MPLSEFYQVKSNGTKPDSSQSKMNTPRSFDLSSASFMPDDEFVELLWENGQVVMHGQSTRPTKKTANFVPTPLQSQLRETHFEQKNDTTFSLFPKIPSFGSVDPTDPHFADPKSSIGLSSDDEDTVPWMNCSIDESLCSEMLCNLNQADHFVNPSPVPVLTRSSVPMLKSKKKDLVTKQQDLPPVISNKPRMNFSHFTRPLAVPKAGLQSAERLRSNEKTSTSYNNNPLEPAFVQSRGHFENMAQHMPPSLSTMRVIYQKEIVANNSFGNNRVNKEKEKEKVKEKEKEKEKAKACEIVAVSSSVCSGKVEPKHSLKRKSLEEGSSFRDEDIDESVELKRPNSSKTNGTKRSRTAEVHNLSERRRRDRINEKMRALQDLIPNCNKVDKASMLEEAIEYLKSLQVQVQMMAMGAGYYMPPHMMIPPGMHQMRHMAPPFHHMGMGMGYGIGVLDLNGYPAIHPPIMQGGRNVLPNGGVGMFGFPPQSGLTMPPNSIHNIQSPNLNKENAGESCTHIESALQREDVQGESD